MVKPFIKWAGGKRQLLKQLVNIVEQNFSNYENYIEPFVGGGALLLELLPKSFIINDQNKELINLYEVVKDYPYELIKLLDIHQKNNSKDYYYSIRNLDRDKNFEVLDSIDENFKIEKSARFIYLNKTCFNGLYRVNSKGHFNVPFGNYKTLNICNINNLLLVSNFLNNSKNKFFNYDFEFVMQFAKPNDLVYFDPPYIPLENRNSFTNYTKNGFNLEDQIRLRDCVLKLILNKVNVLISNSYTKKTIELYDLDNINSKFNYVIVSANRFINSNGKNRKAVKEIIIWNKKEIVKND